MGFTPRDVPSILQGTLPVSHLTPIPSYPHRIPVSLHLQFSCNPVNCLNGAEHVYPTPVIYSGEQDLFPRLSGKSWLACIPPGVHDRRSLGIQWPISPLSAPGSVSLRELCFSLYAYPARTSSACPLHSVHVWSVAHICAPPC